MLSPAQLLSLQIKLPLALLRNRLLLQKLLLSALLQLLILQLHHLYLPLLLLSSSLHFHPFHLPPLLELHPLLLGLSLALLKLFPLQRKYLLLAPLDLLDLGLLLEPLHLALLLLPLVLLLKTLPPLLVLPVHLPLPSLHLALLGLQDRLSLPLKLLLLRLGLFLALLGL